MDSGNPPEGYGAVDAARFLMELPLSVDVDRALKFRMVFDLALGLIVRAFSRYRGRRIGYRVLGFVCGRAASRKTAEQDHCGSFPHIRLSIDRIRSR